MQDGEGGRSGDKCIGRREGGASEVGREIELRCGREGRKNRCGKRASLPSLPPSLRVWHDGRIRAFGVFQVFVRCAIYFKGKEGIERCASERSGAGEEGMELVGGRNCLGGDLWNLWRNKRGYFLERRRERGRQRKREGRRVVSFAADGKGRERKGRKRRHSR